MTFKPPHRCPGRGDLDIVATKVGDRLERHDCIVTAAWEPPFVCMAGDDFEHSEDEMLVSLNCAVLRPGDEPGYLGGPSAGPRNE